MSEDLAELIASSTISNIKNRGLTQATCEHWDYRVRINSRGEGEHIAVYRDDHRQPIFAKVRNIGVDGTGKEFSIVPSGAKTDRLYGQERLTGGKMLVVCEGEIDCLTVSQLWANKFPVVSLSKGVGGAKKDFAKNLEALSRYDKVVICFDMDEVGQKAAVECARLLPPGVARIANLPRKDPNEMHQAGEDTILTGLLHNAPEYRPDGILSGAALKEAAQHRTAWGPKFGIDFLDKLQWGWRDGEVVVCGAGSGIGKSDLMYQVAAFQTRENNLPTAVFNYESSPARIALGIAGKNTAKRYTNPDHEGLFWTEADLDAALTDVTQNHAMLFVNDSKGRQDWESVKERLRFLAHAHGVKRAFVDPMAAMAAGMAKQVEGIDLLMAEAVALAEELSIGLWFNSHLTKPPGDTASHEEGGRVKLSQFRGSNAIIMWSALVFGGERNQQAEDPLERNTTYLRSLKVREAGENTGQVGAFCYNTITGILDPREPEGIDQRLPDGGDPPGALEDMGA